jgi:hypothetical protein
MLTLDSRFLNGVGQALLGGPNIGAVFLLTADFPSDLQVFAAPTLSAASRAVSLRPPLLPFLKGSVMWFAGISAAKPRKA